MKQWTAIVADDEDHLRAGLIRILEKRWPELEIIGQAGNGIEAAELIETLKPDIAFLDIQMPGMTGIAVAKKAASLCRIVFITAYDQYAVQAFEREAVDYILKPPTEERLIKTIHRLKTRTSSGQTTPPKESVLPDTNIQAAVRILENLRAPEYLKLVKVKSGSEIRFIPTAEVIYFKAEDKYTVVQTVSREFLIRTTIKDLESQLDPEIFWRVHRGAIINIERVRAIKRSFTNQMLAAFDGTKQTIPVSRSYEHLFRHM